MNGDRPSNGSSHKSWLERISHAFLGEPQDREELLGLLRDAEQRKLLDSEALTMIERVLSVSEMQVRDIMIPRTQMVVIQQGAKWEEMLPIIIESGHSRFPVVGENRDDVIGILLAKDLLTHVSLGGQQAFNVVHIMRPAVFIPESKRLNVLLREFRASRNHMAIVVDEYGGVAGLVTIEDVLEQIVGDIADEHDIDEDIFIKKHSDNAYLLKALTPIEEFNEYFGTDFSDEEFDTIGGLVMQPFGHLPKPGETIQIGRFTFRVLHSDSLRIHLLHLTVDQNQEVIKSSAATG